METQLNPQIYEVDASNFEAEVLQASRDKLVVVDFWAPWCGPCRTLGPILEEVVGALGTGVALAKVNVDENQQLALAFRVQSIPAVKIVKEGQLVDEFTGALPREQVEARLRRWVSGAPEAQKGEELEARARSLFEAGDLEGAARAYEEILGESPGESAALFGLARIRLLEGEFEAVEELVARIEADTPEREQAQSLLMQLEFRELCAGAGGRQACARRRLADPEDLEARYLLACCAAAEGDFSTALEEWLEVVERRKDFRQGAARKAMVSVFHLLGRHSQIVADYPQRLYRALY